MTSKPPPVPKENRTDKGPDADAGTEGTKAAGDVRDRNLAKQGRQGDIKQNTTNQGYQQDR